VEMRSIICRNAPICAIGSSLDLIPRQLVIWRCRLSLTNRSRALIIGAGVAVAVAVLAGATWLIRWPPGLFAGSSGGSGAAAAGVPSGAGRAVMDLASRDPATVRSALAAGYDVSKSDLAPAGTSIRMEPGTWRQQGDDAAVLAVVTAPGRKPVTETIYLVRQEGQWRVLFTDPS
jgi:hypothetical protein